jgi:hypothetical protein
MSVADPMRPATSINAEMKTTQTPSVSDRTIRGRLLQFDLHARHAVKKPFISDKNRKARVAFARQHKDWTPAEWMPVLWSDESRFQRFYSDGLHYVRRPRGTRILPRYQKPTVKHGGGCVIGLGVFLWQQCRPSRENQWHHGPLPIS